MGTCVQEEDGDRVGNSGGGGDDGDGDDDKDNGFQ